VDSKTVILGVVPAGLAILLELRSPVSEKVIRTQSFQQSEQFVPEAVTGVVRQQQKNAIATVMTGTAIGAAEVAGLVPTWISLMVALTAGLSEFMDPIWCLTMVIIMTAVAAILSLNFSKISVSTISGIRPHLELSVGDILRLDVHLES
jgi:hypothetical protein